MRFYISNKFTGDDSTLLVEDQILNSKALLYLFHLLSLISVRIIFLLHRYDSVSSLLIAFR